MGMSLTSEKETTKEYMDPMQYHFFLDEKNHFIDPHQKK